MALKAILLSSLAGIALASPLSDLTSPAFMFDRRDTATTCGIGGGISCRNTTAASNLCCFEYPGGLIVLPQFWNPSNGPVDSWTIHGLWPDLCTGGFEQFCDEKRGDKSRDYPASSLSGMLRDQGASDTLAFMQKFWVDRDGNPESFWQHEWTKHGTCMSTFMSSCLPAGSPRGADAVAYFQSTVRMFKTLPTYKWLAEQGITPSLSATYTRSQLFAALKAASGFTPALDCTSGVVSQIYWYFNLQGSAIDGKYVPVDAPRTGNCPSDTGIKYTPKGAGSTTTAGSTTSTSRPPTTPTQPSSGSLPTKGAVKAVVNGATTGGILTAGTWSTQTLATVTFSGTVSSFTMSTSKGNCAITSGALSCGSGVTPSSFSATQSSGQLLIAYEGATSFSSDGTPSGTTVFTVFAGSGHSSSYTLAIV